MIARASFIAALCLSTAALARAQSSERPPVSVSLEACPDFDATRVRSVLAAELGALLVPTESADARETTRVTVTCDETIITLAVADPVTGKSLERRIGHESLHRVGRERFLALAIAELVAASWIELEVTPTPVIAPVDRVASEETRDVAHRAVMESAPLVREGQVRVSVLGAINVAASPLRGSFGGGARLDHEPHELLGWSLALWGEHASASTDLGDVSIDQAGAQLEATLRFRWDPVMLQLALGARGALALLQGTSSSSPDVQRGTLLAPVLAPHAAVRVWGEPVRAFFVMFGAGFSWTLLSAHGLVDGARAVNVEGPALHIEVGVGLRLD